MLSITCSVVYSNGDMLTGTMQAASASGKYDIKYAGATERWNRLPKSATPAAFEVLFATAIHDGAVGGGVGATGEYDYGPRYVPNDRFMELQRNRYLYQRA